MAARITPETKQAIIEAYIADESLTYRELSKKFDVHFTSVRNIIKAYYRARNQLAPKRIYAQKQDRFPKNVPTFAQLNRIHAERMAEISNTEVIQMPKGQKMDALQKAMIAELIRDGVVQKEIAERCGCSVQTVARVAKQERERLQSENPPKDPTAPPRDVISGFTPLYQRIIELNREKQRINAELNNLKATLRNALEIAESGEVPK